MTDPSLADLRASVLGVVRSKGYLRLEQPVKLRSGGWSHDYIDGKRAFAAGDDLRLAATALIRLATEEGWTFDAVGGLTLGADPFAHAIAVLSGAPWFVVRKAEKDHGTQQRVEGTSLGAGVRVLLVDDTVTMGGSILQAFHAIRGTGATVAAATAIVDRGAATAAMFAELGVPYRALLTYADLGIAPVDGGGTEATG